MDRHKNRRIALMSIHPKYANAIFEGRKKFEFRKCRFASPVSHVLVYATAPVRRIIGLFEVGDIVEGSPRSLWKQFSEESGVDPGDYDNYFAGSRKAFAIAVKDPVLLKHPVRLDDLRRGLSAPQSFVYCASPSAERLIARA